nr:MAG TPA: hypothetical protein [Caudoviricetes sp.]
MENSIEEDIKNIEEIIELSKEEIDAKDENITAILDIEDLIGLEHILSDYKRVLKENESLKEYNMEYKRILDLADDRIYRKKYLEERRKEQPNLLYPDSDEIYQRYCELKQENEELKISNKEIDKECSRLEKKEVELINENEHYEDLIYALKTYYDITEEDLEKCMKNDR